jgi:hypothetical protein
MERIKQLRLITSLLLVIALLFILSDEGESEQRALTGSVSEFHAGLSIRVTNEQTDPTGVQIALRHGTVYENGEDDAAVTARAITPGVRVTVWYRTVGERRPIADRVRVHASRFGGA